MSAYLDLPRRTETEAARATYLTRLERLATAYDRSAHRYANSADARDTASACDFRVDAAAIRWALDQRENMLAALRAIVEDIEGGDHTTGHRIARVAIDRATGEGT